jgi:hypothetical protein
MPGPPWPDRMELDAAASYLEFACATIRITAPE